MDYVFFLIKYYVLNNYYYKQKENRLNYAILYDYLY